jgi:hypothetical protein
VLATRFGLHLQVNAAVELVQQGKTEDAVALLKEGISTFTPNFPDRHANNCGV